MDQRNSSVRVPIVRQPLDDATKRVNNATAAAMNCQAHVGKAEDAASKHKRAIRGRSNPTVGNELSARQTATHTRSASAAAPTTPVNLRLSAITQESHDPVDGRCVSQFSNVSSNASSIRPTKAHIGPWQLGKTLGKGSSARVRLGRHRATHQLVAVKIVAKNTAHITQAGSLANLDRLDHRKPSNNVDWGLRRMPLAIEREVAILKLIQHPNIIELIDIWESHQEM